MFLRIIKIKNQFFLLSGLLLLLSHSGKSQSFFKAGSIPFFISGEPLSCSQCGGLNSPQFSSGDFDEDGEQELVAFDRSNNKFFAYTFHDNQWKEKVYRSNPFPSCSHWALFRDFDGDGRKDLFTAGNFSNIKVYKNTGAGFTPVSGSLQTTFTFPGQKFSTDLYVSDLDLPAIEDYDKDGDLDIFTFSVSGNFMELHKNLSKETSGNSGLIFEAKNLCYGYFEESFENNTITLAVKNCGVQVENPEKNYKHTGSTVFSGDLNADGRNDLVLGDITYNNLVALTMTASTLGGDSAVSAVNFPFENPVNVEIFPAAFQVDYPGLEDCFLFAPNAINGIDNQTAVKKYCEGFEPFLQPHILDLGEGAFPLLSDFNQDGLADLLLSSKGTSTGNGEYRSVLKFFRNRGTPANPVFEESELSQPDLSTELQSFNFIPAPGNFSSGANLLVGDASGKMHLLQFTFPALTLVSQAIKNEAGEVIDVGDYAHPTAFDLNGDGWSDILVGERTGNVNYYRNNGDQTFTLISENFGNIDVRSTPGEQGYSTPFLYPGETQKILFVGSASGNMWQIELTEAGEVSNTARLNIDEGRRVTLSAGDLNQDGKWDVATGLFTGGIGLWLQENPNDIIENRGDLSIYPNPVSEVLQIYSQYSFTSYTLYTISGKLISYGMLENQSISLSGVSSGTYLLSCKSANGEEKRTVVIKR